MVTNRNIYLDRDYIAPLQVKAELTVLFYHGKRPVRQCGDEKVNDKEVVATYKGYEYLGPVETKATLTVLGPRFYQDQSSE